MKETLQPGAVYRDPQDDNAVFVCAGETDQLGETPIVNWNGTHGTAWGDAALYVKEADSIQEYTEVQRNRADSTLNATDGSLSASDYLRVALGGNMNFGTLKPLEEIMDSYADHKIKHLKENSKCEHPSKD